MMLLIKLAVFLVASQGQLRLMAIIIWPCITVSITGMCGATLGSYAFLRLFTLPLHAG
jgi:hypothetical protein